MPAIRLIAILFFVASITLGGIALKNAYGAYAERTNTDVSRAVHVITEAGGYQYIYSVDAKTLARLKSDAWMYTFYCAAAIAVGAILWELAEITDKLKRNA